MNLRRTTAFTLVELLVAMVVSLILVVMLVGVVDQINKTVSNTSLRMDAFQSAQSGFDIMTQKLANATLNTYYGYDSPSAPTVYIRLSDLHFYVAQNSDLTGSPINSTANANSGHSIYFQAPEGYSNTSATYANTPGLLNACGYFVAFGSDKSYRPMLFGSSRPKYRYRLMQAIQSTENNGIYADQEILPSTQTPPPPSPPEAPPWIGHPNPWFVPLNASALPIADNVIALIVFNPSLDPAGNLISADYRYNSRQGIPPPPLASSPDTALQSEQMPPVLQVSMVTIDEPSALRLDDGTGAAPAIIENALKGKFTVASSYAKDLSDLETTLAANHIHYQTLATSITLRESKWSSGQ